MRELAYILVIDQSTSATKAIIFDEKANIIKRSNVYHEQIYPKPGWVEHDPEEIYNNTIIAMKTVLNESGVNPSEIIALGITNQRETVLVWDKTTGKPVYNAVVWQCKRGEEICERIRSEETEELIKKKTGLKLSPYFSAAKVKWILDNLNETYNSNNLLFGTIDCWLVWELTKGESYATDYSNASRTQLFNIVDLKWDDELFNLFEIDLVEKPKVLCSDEIFGYTTAEGIFPKPIPICGVIGDSQGALFGQGCWREGDIKATYGTGSSIMMNTGEKIVVTDKLSTSIAWGFENKVSYVIEGNINFSGATLKWLAENLELIGSVKECANIAKQVKSTDGVYFVPAFTGLASPYWNSRAKAAIVGMNVDTKKAHIVRAAEESMAYQVRDIIEAIKEVFPTNICKLNADGGPTKDEFLMQFQADILGIPVYVNNLEEVSALGAMLMAGFGIKMWRESREVLNLIRHDRIYMNNMDEITREQLYRGWKKAVDSVLMSS